MEARRSWWRKEERAFGLHSELLLPLIDLKDREKRDGWRGTR